jgi:DNA-binding protein HU-beta
MATKAQDLSQRQLIKAMARQSGIESDKAEAAIRALVTFIESELAKGEAVLVPGLGKFAIERLERAEGRNPETGAVMTIPAFNRPVFLAAAEHGRLFQHRGAAPADPPRVSRTGGVARRHRRASGN